MIRTQEATGKTVDEARANACAKLGVLPERGGIGRYPKDKAHPKRKTGWVHVDTRPKKSRWTL